MEQVTEKFMTLFPINCLSAYVLYPVWVEVAVSILMQSLIRYWNSQGNTIQQRQPHLSLHWLWNEGQGMGDVILCHMKQSLSCWPEQLLVCLAFCHQLIEDDMFSCNTHPLCKANCVHLKANAVQGLNPPGSTLTTTSVGLIFQLACIRPELFL